MMTEADSKLYTDIMTAARKHFAETTRFSVEFIEGRSLQITLTDVESGEIIKKTSLIKHLAKIGFKITTIGDNA